MTLDEAIKHLEDTLSDNNHEWSCTECKAEHEQLTEWLKDYKRLLTERREGEWIEEYCNKCGRSSLCDGWGRNVESRFCPNCGAKMRKGEAENEQTTD